jgi:hypothetical protein
MARVIPPPRVLVVRPIMIAAAFDVPVSEYTFPTCLPSDSFFEMAELPEKELTQTSMTMRRRGVP